jgi:hypothetical protein
VNWDVEIMQIDIANGLTESNVLAGYEYARAMRALYNDTDGSKGAFIVVTNASWGIDSADPADFPVWCGFYDALGAEGVLNCGATTNSPLNVDAHGVCLGLHDFGHRHGRQRRADLQWVRGDHHRPRSTGR